MIAALLFLAGDKVNKALGMVATFITSAFVCALILGAPLLGWFEQPWSRWWFSGHAVVTAAGEPITGPVTAGGDVPSGPQPAVSDVRRYQLATGAGFSGGDAITAVAVSIAENGSGNPAALSGLNFNGSRDLGLWQINSAWWPTFGGQTPLTNPVVNAIAAYYVWQRQGWCAWSTFEASCGPGHNSAYRAYLDRAREAARQ